MARMDSPLLVCTTVVALSGRMTRARLHPSPPPTSAAPAAGEEDEFGGLSLDGFGASVADDVEPRLQGRHSSIKYRVIGTVRYKVLITSI